MFTLVGGEGEKRTIVISYENSSASVCTYLSSSIKPGSLICLYIIFCVFMYSMGIIIL